MSQIDTAMFLLGTSAIGVFSGLLGTYVASKFLFSTSKLNEKAVEVFEDIVEYVATSEPMQKNIYLIGALIGNGAKKGIGMSGGGVGGKFSLKGLAGDVISAYIQKQMGGGQTGGGQSQDNGKPGEF